MATKLWNLKFGLTKIIGTDLERLFCEKPFDDKEPTVKDDALFESLQRTEIAFSQEIHKDNSGNKYLLLNKTKLGETHKEFDKTNLVLTS